MKLNERFGKEYKCCSKKNIDLVFQSNQKIKLYPFITYYKIDDYEFDTAFQVVISVPKRNLKKAHDRNRIKRLIKEVMRKNKHLIEIPLMSVGHKMLLFFIYTAQEELKYVILDDKIKRLFEQLNKQLSLYEKH